MEKPGVLSEQSGLRERFNTPGSEKANERMDPAPGLRRGGIEKTAAALGRFTIGRNRFCVDKIPQYLPKSLGIREYSYVFRRRPVKFSHAQNCKASENEQFLMQNEA